VKLKSLVSWVLSKLQHPFSIGFQYILDLQQWGAGTVICLGQHADLHMVQLMPVPLIVSCFSKIQTGFTFLVPAHLGNPG